MFNNKLFTSDKNCEKALNRCKELNVTSVETIKVIDQDNYLDSFNQNYILQILTLNAFHGNISVQGLGTL